MQGAFMNKLAALSAIFAALIVSAGPSYADNYSDSTPCAQMATAFNNKDMDGIADAVQYIENVFDGLDSRHVENGEPGVVDQWSDQGLRNNVAVVAGWCQQHQKETVYNAAAEVYNGLRSMEMALGVAK
jgi:hypothetical protein